MNMQQTYGLAHNLARKPMNGHGVDLHPPPTRIIGDVSRILSFVREHMALAAVENMKGLGLERDGRLVAGVIYEGFNGRNVWMHVAAVPGQRWMNRQYLHYCFEYPFDELKVDRVSGYVNASNADAIRFDEHLGFQREAVLSGAAPDGGDVILYVMRRNDCRYLRS